MRDRSRFPGRAASRVVIIGSFAGAVTVPIYETSSPEQVEWILSDSAARAVVVPSEWYENAPLAALEGAALGKPLIVARIGGLPELVVELVDVPMTLAGLSRFNVENALAAASAGVDEAHVAVEFVHPVIVGKRALPALGVPCSDAALLVPDPEEIEQRILVELARSPLFASQFRENAARLTTVGLVVLFFTAMALMLTVDRSINAIWRVRRARPFWISVLSYVVLLSVGPLLIGISVSITTYLMALPARVDVPEEAHSVLLQAVPSRAMDRLETRQKSSNGRLVDMAADYTPATRCRAFRRRRRAARCCRRSPRKAPPSPSCSSCSTA